MLQPTIATKKDIDAVYLIISECSDWLAKQGMNHWKSYYNKEKVEERLVSQDYKILLLKSETGDPIGTQAINFHAPEYYTVNQEQVNHLHKFTEPDAPAMYLTMLGIRPKYQGQNYGAFFIKYAEEEAKRMGAKYTRFDTRGDQTKLVNFYKRLGYKIVGEIPDTDSPYFLFEKKLN